MPAAAQVLDHTLDRPDAAAEASPAAYKRDRRAILIHLTPHARAIPPDARITAPCRWMRFCGADALQAMRRLVERLDEPAWDLRLEASAQGEVEVHPAGVVHCPLALIVEGLTLAEAEKALDALARSARQ